MGTDLIWSGNSKFHVYLIEKYSTNTSSWKQAHSINTYIHDIALTSIITARDHEILLLHFYITKENNSVCMRTACISILTIMFYIEELRQASWHSHL